MLERVTRALRAFLATRALPPARALQARARRSWADALAGRSSTTVGQIMNRHVETCRLDETLADAAGTMWDRDVGQLPVVASDGRAVGAVTDRDICMAAYLHGRALGEISVSVAMSKDLHTCGPNDPVRVAEEIMRDRQLRRLPVVDASGSLVGVISLNDLAREAEGEGGKTKRQVTAKEVTVTLAAIGAPRPAPAR